MNTDALIEALRSVVGLLGPNLVRHEDVARLSKRLTALEALVDDLEALVERRLAAPRAP